MSLEFRGRAGLVTGGASGIGLAIAMKLVEAGGAVTLVDMDREAGQAAMSLIVGASGSVSYEKADVSDPLEIDRAIRNAAARYGRLDFCVCAAGIGGARGESLVDYDITLWRKVVDVNLNGVFYTMKSVLPHLLAAGGGAIVNIASVYAERGTSASPAYAAAKHGVVGLTRSAAIAYAQQNIRINAIAPGYVETPLLKQLSEDGRQNAISRHPIGRLGKAEEIADFAIFLLSKNASFVTGSLHHVDGGFSA